MSNPAARAAHVLLVDDHPVFRQGVRFLLEDAGFVVAGEAANARDAVGMINAVRGDVALLDLSLGADSGLSLMGPLRSRGIPAVVCSMHDDRRHIEMALTAGASGYVAKDESGDTLVSALRSVLRGRPFVSPRIGATLSADEGAGLRMDSGTRLSQREQEVLEYLGAGYAVSEIATRLEVSPRTVEAYANRLINKLGLIGMRELRRYAMTTARPVQPN